MDHVSIFSLNSRGTLKHYDKIIDQIKSFDIVMLQEQHIQTEDIIKKIEKDTKRKLIFSKDTTNNKTIMFLLKQQLATQIIDEGTLIEGRVMYIKLKIKGKSYNFLNVYAPAAQTERLEFFRKLFSKTEGMTNIRL